MKKLLTIAMMTAAVSAMAVESSNTFGILRVDSSAPETIVSIPWLAAGGGNINVSDVVKTANLNSGDELYYYNAQTTNYRVWRLTNGVWQEAVPAGQTAAAEPTLARGNAIILKRNAPIANCFYLYGQYGEIAAGTEMPLVAGGLSLIAPPMTTDINIANLTWTNVNKGDKILIPSDKPGVNGEIIRNSAGKPEAGDAENTKWVTLKYDSTKPVGQKWVETEVTYLIPAGRGVWYKSAGSSAASVTWVAPAQ